MALSMNSMHHGYTASLMPKMLSAKQPGDPVFKEGDEQIAMANPVWLFLGMESDQYLEWFFHYKSLNSKLSRAVYILNKVKKIHEKSVLHPIS